MTGGRLSVTSGLLLAFLLVVAACDRHGTEARSTFERGPLFPQSSIEHGQSAALRAWVDPETGQLSAPPASQAWSSVVRGGAAAGTTDLVIAPGRTTAGGVMVDLRGHFTYGLRASVSSEGRVTARCESRDEMGAGE